MKNSLKYIPFFNIAATLSNSIFVNRSSKESAKHTLDQSVISTMIKTKRRATITMAHTVGVGVRAL